MKKCLENKFEIMNEINLDESENLDIFYHNWQIPSFETNYQTIPKENNYTKISPQLPEGLFSDYFLS